MITKPYFKKNAKNRQQNVKRELAIVKTVVL